MQMLYEIKNSATGQGLFARGAFRKGERVIEYTGKKIPNTLADALTTRFLFDLENGFTIDGDGEENLARFVNHSCAPNCEAELVSERVFFNALRDIVAGEEITIDYGNEYFDEFIKPEGCKCFQCRFRH